MEAGQPLTWGDLRAFLDLTGDPLGPEAARAVKAASRAFHDAVQEYDGQARPAPHGYEQEARRAVESAIRAGFGQFTGAKR